MNKANETAAVREFFRKKGIPETFNEAMPRLRCKLVGDAGKDRLTDGILYVKELDLAVVPFYDGEEGTGATYLLPTEVTKIWEKTQAEITQAALAATWKAYPPRMQALGDDLYVLSAGSPETDATWYSFGAVAMVMPDVLLQVASILQADFYLIPDMMDEVLIIPIREGAENADPDELRQILSRIHTAQFAELPYELILPDTVYIYRRGIGLTIA